MKKTLSASLILLLFVTTFAQAPDTLWTKTFGGNYNDYGRSVQQTKDGGYIIIGSGEADVWLIKTDVSGNTLWQKTFGESSYSDEGLSVQQTTDGGYIIVGWTDSFGSVNYDRDVWLIKTDALGDTLWTRTFGGNDLDAGYSVQQTTDGGYIIVGETESFGAGLQDVWLIKTNSSGDTTWTKIFGGALRDCGYSIEQTTDGGYIITGYTSSFGVGGRDLWLIKTDSSGDTIWSKTFGGSSNDEGYSIQQTTDGGYIVTGYTSSFGAGGRDLWLIKTDGQGGNLWTKTFGGSGWDSGSSVMKTTDGGFIIVGRTESFGTVLSDIWLIKTDASGDTMWTKTFDGGDYDTGASGQQTTDGGYIIVGDAAFLGAGQDDIWLIKTTPDINGIEQNNDLTISGYYLQQNYPNPFNPSTKIKFTIANLGFAILKIYDVLGNELATLVDEYKPAGSYEVQWDASGLPSGIYFYQLKTDGFVETKKMILFK